MKSLNPPPWTPEEDAKLLALLEKGLSPLNIAMKLRRSKDSVRNRLIRLRKEARDLSAQNERAAALPDGRD
jgi:hypothetical protein